MESAVYMQGTGLYELISINVRFLPCCIVDPQSARRRLKEVLMATTESEFDQLRSDIQKLRADIEQIGATIGRVGKKTLRDVGVACDPTRTLRAKWRNTAQGLSDKIEENPVRAALATFGIGLVIGRILSGRRR